MVQFIDRRQVKTSQDDQIDELHWMCDSKNRRVAIGNVDSD